MLDRTTSCRWAGLCDVFVSWLFGGRGVARSTSCRWAGFGCGSDLSSAAGCSACISAGCALPVAPCNAWMCGGRGIPLPLIAPSSEQQPPLPTTQHTPPHCSPTCFLKQPRKQHTTWRLGAPLVSMLYGLRLVASILLSKLAMGYTVIRTGVQVLLYCLHIAALRLVSARLRIGSRWLEPAALAVAQASLPAPAQVNPPSHMPQSLADRGCRHYGRLRHCLHGLAILCFQTRGSSSSSGAAFGGG